MVPVTLSVPFGFENDHRPCGTDYHHDNDHEWG